MDGVDGGWRAAAASSTIRSLVAVLCLLVGLGGLIDARPVAAAPRGRVRLVRQTSWVAPGETLSLALRTADVADAAALELAVTVHPAVKTRVELARSMVGEGLTSPIGPRSSAAVPLPEVPAAVDGTLSVQVPTQDLSAPPDPARVRLRGRGIYPVQVELRELGGGETVDRFTTHLLAVAAPTDGSRLNAAVVLPLSAPPSTGLAGVPPGPPAGASALADTAAGLTAAARVPVTLAPTPEILDSLLTSDPTTAAALRQALADRDVLGRPYVPVDVPALGAAAAPLLPEHLATGQSAAREALGSEPLGGIWLADEPLDGPALAQVAAAGAPRLLLPQAWLGPTGPAVPSPLRPVALAGRPRAGDTAPGVTALVADGTLASGLDGRGAVLDQPLTAHHLLADLAALATLPADQGLPAPTAPLDRGVATVVSSRDFMPSSAFLTELLGGLEASPVVKAVDLATAFALPVEPPGPSGPAVRAAPAPSGPAAPGRPAAASRPTTTTRGRRGTTTTVASVTGHTLAPLPADAVARGIGDVLADAIWQLDTAGQVLTGSAPLEGSDPTGNDEGPSTGEQRRRLLVATSADLPVEQRRARLRGLAEEANADLAGLKMPGERTLRLTARTGQLPVGISNDTGRTAQVLLQLDSEKLDFPRGNSAQVVLDRRTTTSQILVRVRASGSFPVKVRLLTPDGGRVLQETEYVVRANSLPGVAIAVSGGAILVLAFWWARTLLPERRHARHRHGKRASRSGEPAAPAGSGSSTDRAARRSGRSRAQAARRSGEHRARRSGNRRLRRNG